MIVGEGRSGGNKSAVTVTRGISASFHPGMWRVGTTRTS